MNPLLSRNNYQPQSQPSGDPMDALLNTLSNGANPQQLVQSTINNNPKAVQEIKRMQQECGNQNPRDYILNYFQNNGMNTNRVMQVAKMLGLK